MSSIDTTGQLLTKVRFWAQLTLYILDRDLISKNSRGGIRTRDQKVPGSIPGSAENGVKIDESGPLKSGFGGNGTREVDQWYVLN